MARTKISEFSATAADNTDIDNIDIAEGCAPSGINNAIRELMSQLKDFQTGAASDPFNGAVNGTLGATTPAAATITNLTYTGTLTGGTGVINIGSNQIYKDASGNVGLGSPAISTSARSLDIDGISNTSRILLKSTTATAAVATLSLDTTNALTVLNSSAWTTAFNVNGAERMRINTSGNVGIGTASPSQRLSIASSLNNDGVQITNTSTTNTTAKTTRVGFFGTDTTGNVKEAADIYTIPENANYIDASLGFYTRSTDVVAERMRLDSSGNLLLGASSGFGTSALLNVLGNSGRNFACALDKSTAASAALALNRSDDGDVANFYRAWAGGGVGSISVTTTTTTYNTSSDYRLKENVAPMTGALAKVAALKPVTYTWKADGSDGQGFIAHELQSVIPDAVTGEKDAVDKDGKPKYQGVDTSFLVATLVAAIQELKAEFDAYKASHP